MLRRNDIARLRFELAAYLAAPHTVFEGPSRPGCLLNWRNVLPGFVVARAVSTMQRIEDTDVRLPRRTQDLLHMKDALICFCDALQHIPYFAALGYEIVIGIDHQKCGDLLFICSFHVSVLSPECV